MLIFDNFLPEHKFNILSEFVLSNRFPWFYSSHVSLPPWEEFGIEDSYAQETDGWYHLLYADNENNSMYMRDFNIFFEELKIQLGYTLDDLIRARLGLKHPKLGFSNKNYNLPHIDYHYPHDTIIYYLNDSDGDTRMFKEHASSSDDPTQFTVEKRIEPKANRLVLFDGLQYHTASNPIETNRRVILNVNLQCR